MSDNAATRLLPAEALARIRNLEVAAKQVVEGFITGRHKSPYKGFSVEFAEHRQYVPGDDIKDLDWRVLAKNDRYYIKQYEEETNLRAYMLLDASGSMKYKGESGLSKYEYARHLAAALTYLLLNQQDAVGLVTYDSSVRKYIPPRSAANHLRVLLEELDRTEPAGETGLSGIFHDIAERIKRRGVVVILSDLFDDIKTLAPALQHMRYKRHDVILVHIMAPEELTFPFRQWSQFRNLESETHKLMLDPMQIRDEYLRQLRLYLDELKKQCGQMQIDYVQMSTAEPYDKALAMFLSKRAARK